MPLLIKHLFSFVSSPAHSQTDETVPGAAASLRHELGAILSMAMRRLALRSQRGADGVSRAEAAEEAAMTGKVDLAAAAKEGSPTGGGAASSRLGEKKGVRRQGASSRDATERRNTLSPSLSPNGGSHLSLRMPSSRTDNGSTVATVAAAAAEEGARNGNGSSNGNGNNGVENGHNAVEATKTTTGMRA